LAGLQAARARGKLGGRSKGLSKEAEAFYKQGGLSVQEIADKLGIAKSTLYRYIKQRKVKVDTNSDNSIYIINRPG